MTSSIMRKHQIAESFERRGKAANSHPPPTFHPFKPPSSELPHLHRRSLRAVKGHDYSRSLSRIRSRVHWVGA